MRVLLYTKLPRSRNYAYANNGHPTLELQCFGVELYDGKIEFKFNSREESDNFLSSIEKWEDERSYSDTNLNPFCDLEIINSDSELRSLKYTLNGIHFQIR